MSFHDEVAIEIDNMGPGVRFHETVCTVGTEIFQLVISIDPDEIHDIETVCAHEDTPFYIGLGEFISGRAREAMSENFARPIEFFSSPVRIREISRTETKRMLSQMNVTGAGWLQPHNESPVGNHQN